MCYDFTSILGFDTAKKGSTVSESVRRPSSMESSNSTKIRRSLSDSKYKGRTAKRGIAGFQRKVLICNDSESGSHKNPQSGDVQQQKKLEKCENENDCEGYIAPMCSSMLSNPVEICGEHSTLQNYDDNINHIDRTNIGKKTAQNSKENSSKIAVPSSTNNSPQQTPIITSIILQQPPSSMPKKAVPKIFN